MCEERRRLTETFAITARLYAEATVRFGTRNPSQPDGIQVLESAEDALRKATLACAALKIHLRKHKCDGMESRSNGAVCRAAGGAG